MNNIVSVGFLMCEPFEVKHIENKVKNGVAFSEQRASLTALKVIGDSRPKMGEAPIYRESTIYVRGESFKAEWARKEYELDGVKFILVPFEAVLLLKPPPHLSFGTITRMTTTANPQKVRDYEITFNGEVK